MSEQTEGISVSESQITPEQQKQIDEQVVKIQTAVAAFSADPRHQLYKHGPENRQAMTSWLDEKQLEYTEENLHKAYEELSKEGKLVLWAESKLPAEQVQKPNSKENPVDLSFSLVDQQKGRRQVLEGPRNSARDAFIDTARNQPQERIKGGRLHLG